MGPASKNLPSNTHDESPLGTPSLESSESPHLVPSGLYPFPILLRTLPLEETTPPRAAC